MNASFPQIEIFLREFVGLNPDSTPGLVNRAVEGILKERPDLDPVQYLQMLKHSEEELDLLLERVLVPETWFFRYPEAYKYLQRWVAGWQRSSNGVSMRVLSVPCSTGEEPYSIAMTLLDAGLSNNQFSIDAADISSKALQTASEAVYSANSFREDDRMFRDRYFQFRRPNYHLLDTVRAAVRFFRWNVQQDPPPQLRSRYDVIFCRNLFIYFHREAQRKMIADLKQLLSRQGVLFAGHAEAGPLLRPDFQPLEPLKAFVHCKS